MKQIILIFFVLILSSCNNKSSDKIAKITMEEANMLITETIARYYLSGKNDDKTKIFRDELKNGDKIIKSESDVIELSKLAIFQKQKGVEFIKIEDIKRLNIQSYYEISIRSSSVETISVFYSHYFSPPEGMIFIGTPYVTYWYRYKKENGKWKFKDLEIMDGESD